jgi:hypothetical protein
MRRLLLGATFLLVMCTTVDGAAAGAAPSRGTGARPGSGLAAGAAKGGLEIQNGSVWTFIDPGSNACEAITFQVDPDDFTGDRGDSGPWTGGEKTIRLDFQRGPGPASAFDPGIFQGHMVHGGGYVGNFHYKRPVMADRTRNDLEQNVVPGC